MQHKTLNFMTRLSLCTQYGGSAGRCGKLKNNRASTHRYLCFEKFHLKLYPLSKYDFSKVRLSPKYKFSGLAWVCALNMGVPWGAAKKWTESVKGAQISLFWKNLSQLYMNLTSSCTFCGGQYYLFKGIFSHLCGWWSEVRNRDG